MSYSRWSYSYWYTFWAATEAKSVEDELFEICQVSAFTYKQLKDDINRCLRIVKKECRLSFKPESQPTKEEMKELRGYMKEFIQDVESSDAGKQYLQDKILDQKLSLLED